MNYIKILRDRNRYYISAFYRINSSYYRTPFNKNGCFFEWVQRKQEWNTNKEAPCRTVWDSTSTSYLNFAIIEKKQQVNELTRELFFLWKKKIKAEVHSSNQCVPERQWESHFIEASPTLRQPLRLSCLRKPPQRFEMFSTTRPWGTQGQTERGREM